MNERYRKNSDKREKKDKNNDFYCHMINILFLSFQDKKCNVTKHTTLKKIK